MALKLLNHFVAAVHSKEGLSDIELFNYLHARLDELAVAGIYTGSPTWLLQHRCIEIF